MSDAKLLPCPWCQRAPKCDYGFSKTYVGCDNPDCPLFRMSLMEKHQWNARNPSTVLLPTDTLAKVREALEMLARSIGHPDPDKRDRKDCHLRACATDALSLLAAAQKQGEGES